MKIVSLVAIGLALGAATAFLGALLRPRRHGGYDPLAAPVFGQLGQV